MRLNIWMKFDRIGFSELKYRQIGEELKIFLYNKATLQRQQYMCLLSWVTLPSLREGSQFFLA
jgi:hypothetical protein